MIAALAVAAVLSAAPACTVPELAPGGPPWKTGEVLRFAVDVIGLVDAGSLTVAVDRPVFKGTLFPIRARARITPSLAKMKGIANPFAMTWVHARTLRPDRYHEELVENGVHKASDVRFPEDGSDVSFEWQSGERKGASSFTPQGLAFDLISATYYLRSSRLEAGQEICLDMAGNYRFWRVRGTVARGTERVETDAGIFQTVRLDATATRADRPGVSRPIHVWFSTDARHLPVAAVSEIELGPVRAQLTSVKGAGPGSPE